MEVTIPNLGDIDEVEVIELCVAEGDEVAAEDPLLVIESDKASMEIPAPGAGVLKAFKVAVGDTVSEGAVVAVIEAADGGDEADERADEADAESQEAADDASGDEETAQHDQPREAAQTDSGDSTDAGSESSTVEVLVPDIGDASGVVVIEIAVSSGDRVEVDDLLVVLESDKASMEITAEQAGTVGEISVQVDQEVSQGSPILKLEVAGGRSAERSDESPGEVEDKNEGAAEPAPEKKAPPPSASQPDEPARDEEAANAAKVYAGPAVRRLARELGVNLTEVTGTGNRGRIVKDDVKSFVKKAMQSGAGGAATGAQGWPSVASVDYEKFGEVELVDLSRIQQRGAVNLHRSWVNLPHVTQHDEADVTDLEAFRRSLKDEAASKGIKLTPLAFIVKACCAALDEFPNFNASLHEDGKQLVRKRYMNIGIAVDTPEGLVVPVIKAADTKSVWDLSEEIIDLSERARTRKLGMDDLQGGTFSISSLGALGGTGFTPIVNAPEVAILGVSKLQHKPVWDGSAFVPRQMLPLSLSYDHRVINGADGGRFMVFLTRVLSDIRRLAL